MIPERVLPSRTVYAAIRLDDRWSVPPLLDRWTAEVLPHAVERRRREFAAGRWCAARACSGVLGSSVAPQTIGRGRAGAPEWPTGVIGSIAHTRHLAAAVAMSTADAMALGFDVEPLVDTSMAERIAPQIADATELADVRAATGLANPEALTLMFSAKEALFKSLHPLVGRLFDFRDAAVDEIDLIAGRFVMRLRIALAATFPAARRVEGRIALEDDLVFTVVHLGASAQPCQ